MPATGLLAHREGDRGFPWLWFVRAVGLVVTIITLGLTATGAASFSSLGCTSPGKLNYNIAVVCFIHRLEEPEVPYQHLHFLRVQSLICFSRQTVLSFVALVYLLLSTGPTRPLKILPWFIFGQLAIDGVLFIFWLAAAASSSYSCDDLCSACYGLSYVAYANQDCICFDFIYKNKRSTSPNPGNVLLSKRRSRYHSGGGSSSSAVKGGTGDAVISFDAIMTYVSHITSCWTQKHMRLTTHFQNPFRSLPGSISPLVHRRRQSLPPAPHRRRTHCRCSPSRRQQRAHQTRRSRHACSRVSTSCGESQRAVSAAANTIRWPAPHGTTAAYHAPSSLQPYSPAIRTLPISSSVKLQHPATTRRNDRDATSWIRRAGCARAWPDARLSDSIIHLRNRPCSGENIHGCNHLMLC